MSLPTTPLGQLGAGVVDSAAGAKLMPSESARGGPQDIRTLIFQLEEEAERKHQSQTRELQGQVALRDQQVATLRAAMEKLKGAQSSTRRPVSTGSPAQLHAQMQRGARMAFCAAVRCG